jgi:hypothetical protein
MMIVFMNYDLIVVSFFMYLYYVVHAMRCTRERWMMII